MHVEIDWKTISLVKIVVCAEIVMWRNGVNKSISLQPPNASFNITSMWSEEMMWRRPTEETKMSISNTTSSVPLACTGTTTEIQANDKLRCVCRISALKNTSTRSVQVTALRLWPHATRAQDANRNGTHTTSWVMCDPLRQTSHITVALPNWELLASVSELLLQDRWLSSWFVCVDDTTRRISFSAACLLDADGGLWRNSRWNRVSEGHHAFENWLTCNHSLPKLPPTLSPHTSQNQVFQSKTNTAQTTALSKLLIGTRSILRDAAWPIDHQKMTVLSRKTSTQTTLESDH